MPSLSVRSHPHPAQVHRHLDALTGAFALLWLGLVTAFLVADRGSHLTNAEKAALAEARARLAKDVLYRRWAMAVGGVDAHPNETASANSGRMTVTRGDEETMAGTPPDRLSRAYLMQLTHAAGPDAPCRLTSLSPLRPENAPDEWENTALHTLQQGADEVATLAPDNGAPRLRIIWPLTADRTCQSCHTSPRFQAGRLCGGLTTSIPLAPYYAAAARENRTGIVTHALAAVLGLGGLFLGRRSLRHALAQRDLAHSALAENEHRARQLIERLPLITVTRTLDGTVTYANPALVELTGRQLPAAVGQNFFALYVPPAGRAAEEEVFRRFLTSDALYANSTGTILDHAGQPRTIAWQHTRVTDLRGEPLGVTSLGEDITVRAAEDLRLRLLSLAVEQSPGIVLITDARGEIEYVNARFAEVTGFQAHEVVGRNPSLLSSGDAPPEFYREMWETILAGRDWRGVFHNRRKNGEHYWAEARISPIRDTSGQIARFIALQEDITERRRTEQALAESEQRFRTLIEHAPVAVIVHRQNRCVYANACAIRLFGYEENVALAHIDFRSHVLPSSLPLVLAREHQKPGGGVHPMVELDLRRCDGSHLVCESIASHITYNGEAATLALIVDITERRQMLAAVEESEARYRTLVEVAPVAIFSLAQGRFTYANPAAARLFGFASAHDLVGASIWQRVHADSLAAVTALLDRAEAGGEGDLVEVSLLGRAHQRIICAATAVAVTIGRQSAVLALAVDITERRQLEGALRENESRIRETLESTAAGYFLLDREDRLVHANSAFLQFFEQPTLAAARGRPFIELLPEPERRELSEQLLRLACGDEFVGGELRHRRGDGSVAYFSFTAHLVREAGALAGCEGFLLDTTATHASEERYQLLFEQMLDGFALHEMIFDETGQAIDYRFLAINPAFERLLGQPASAVVGRRIREIFPDIDPKWLERYGRVTRTGEPLAITDYSDELDRHLEIAAFRSAEGRFACLVRDVTAKRQLEQQLLQAQKMEAVGQLAGGVAHDYNNILVAILMNLALLRNETGLRPETAASLVELEREAKRASSLTRQLLVFSRRQCVQPACVDFNEQLETTLNMLRRLLGEHIAITARLTPNLPRIVADPGMLDQVVMNLCVNARDAMPSGGSLELSTKAVDFSGPSTVHPEARPGAFLLFAVRDTGTGMDAATRQRLFEPFFTTKEPGKGTGLGLATVFGIVKQHGGWIEVESAPGHGSTFRIFLPFATDPTPVVPVPVRPAASAGKMRETILLVEDDAVARQTISLTLRRDGHQVLESRTVAEALAVWHEHRHAIAALITDIVMPGGRNGFELAAQLRAEHPGLSIVLISGYSDDALRGTPPVEGAIYLSKPFDYDTLIEALHTSLARNRAAN
ncbi:MAG: PAS domain S-box protein [Opitutaceae bacterium]